MYARCIACKHNRRDLYMDKNFRLEDVILNVTPCSVFKIKHKRVKKTSAPFEMFEKP